MTTIERHLHRTTSLRALLFAVACLAAGPSFALYKVVGPDGKVTYTDRPPAPGAGRASPINTRTGSSESPGLLPLELRQAASRYPVTLYTVASDCEPCADARQLLRQRGIPFVERQVVSSEDSEALLKITGGREAPVLAIGAQQLKGLEPQTWNNYLDSAGYPRESRLPPGYAYAPPQPLVERPAAAARPPAAVQAPPPEPAPGSIRF